MAVLPDFVAPVNDFESSSSNTLGYGPTSSPVTDLNNWRHCVELYCSTAPISAFAMFRGTVSCIPPQEMSPSGRGAEVRTTTFNANHPDTVRLYLKPEINGMPEFNELLKQLGGRFGFELKYFVYDNISTDSLMDPNRAQRIAQAELNSTQEGAPDNQKFLNFFDGRHKVFVNAGSQIGESFGNTNMIKFGIVTDIGFVDPNALLSSMLTALNSITEIAVDSTWGSIKSLMNVDPPIPPMSLLDFVAWLPSATATHTDFSSYTDAENMAKTQLLPYSVLWGQKFVNSNLDDAEFRILCIHQKKLYWDMLLSNHNNLVPSVPFKFCKDEIFNPVQIEAISEFYIMHPEPETTTPPASSLSITLAGNFPDEVNLLKREMSLVLIDPFDHTNLGDPAPVMIGPDWWPNTGVQHAQLVVKAENKIVVGNDTWDWGSAANQHPPAVNDKVGGDEWRGILFVVGNGGRVMDYYRWSGHTSHFQETRPIADFKQKYTRSCKGNQKLGFGPYKSLPDSQGRDRISFSFKTWSQAGTVVSDYDGFAVDSKHYFRNTTPDNLLTNIKSGCSIHYGQTGTTVAGTHYSASGGCIVSPLYYKFRRDLVINHAKNYSHPTIVTPNPIIKGDVTLILPQGSTTDIDFTINDIVTTDPNNNPRFIGTVKEIILPTLTTDGSIELFEGSCESYTGILGNGSTRFLPPVKTNPEVRTVGDTKEGGTEIATNEVAATNPTITPFSQLKPRFSDNFIPGDRIFFERDDSLVEVGIVKKGVDGNGVDQARLKLIQVVPMNIPGGTLLFNKKSQIEYWVTGKIGEKGAIKPSGSGDNKVEVGITNDILADSWNKMLWNWKAELGSNANSFRLIDGDFWFIFPDNPTLRGEYVT